MTRNYMRRCATCDAWYDTTDHDEVREHQHPEPQSGPPRDAWRASRLPYEIWIKETPEGRAWKQRELLT